jgi:translation elongation factor EF-1beta
MRKIKEKTDEEVKLQEEELNPIGFDLASITGRESYKTEEIVSEITLSGWIDAYLGL